MLAPQLPAEAIGRARPYVPWAMLDHLAREPQRRVRSVDGTCVFVDVSGLHQAVGAARAARRQGGRRATGRRDRRLLRAAAGRRRREGRRTAEVRRRRAAAAVRRRRAHRAGLRDRGRDGRRTARARLGQDRAGDRCTLRMSVGVHSAEYLLFAVGAIAPRAADRRAGRQRGRADRAAGRHRRDRRERRDLRAAAARRAWAPRAGAGVCCARHRRSSAGCRKPAPASTRRRLRARSRPSCAAHVLAGPQPPEHRIVTVAFLRFEGTDALVAERGPESAADALDALVALVQEAADAEQVCFLGSDIDDDGGKLILTAGAPRALGDEEERMLLALRRIVDAGPAAAAPHRRDPRAAVRGRHRAALPPHVHGDGRRRQPRGAADGEARRRARSIATPLVLERSSTRFETTALEPFARQGQGAAGRGVLVGAVVRGGDAARGPVPVRFPLVGRDRELEQIAQALDDARRGRGRLIELVSEPGMGRSRLMEEVRDRSDGVRVLHATCEPYTMTTPYATWREPLRQVLGVTRTTPTESCWSDCARPRARRPVAAADGCRCSPTRSTSRRPPARRSTQLAPEFRAARLREVVLRFMRRQLAGLGPDRARRCAHDGRGRRPSCVDALARELPLLPWLVVVSRRDRDDRLHGVARRARRAAGAATRSGRPTRSRWPRRRRRRRRCSPHLVALAAERSGGSPQFLRDLLRAPRRRARPSCPTASRARRSHGSTGSRPPTGSSFATRPCSASASTRASSRTCSTTTPRA